MDFQRILIFMGLAVTGYLLILAWQDDYGQRATVEDDPITMESNPAFGGTPVAAPIAPSSTAGVPDSDFIPRTNASSDQLSQGTADTQVSETVVVKTDVLKVEIALLGGDIVAVDLPKYPADLDDPDRALKLIDFKNHYSAQSGLIGPSGTDKDGARPYFESAQRRYELKDGRDELQVRLTLEKASPAGLLVQKVLTFKRGDYLVAIEYELSNQSNDSAQVAFYGQIKRDGNSPLFQVDNAMGLQPFLGGATRNEEERYSKIDLSDLEEDPYQMDFVGGYMAFVQHYFLSAWAPAQNENVRYYARQLKKGQSVENSTYVLGYTSALQDIPPGRQSTLGGTFYVGPKDQARLAEISEGLDLTVDYGFLWFIAQPLFTALTWIHSMVNNWGFAIILLTIGVKTLLYPLSAASFKSMAKMRKLQPEMARLKERYGEDRQKFSQAMMDLYKKEGANPLGGCLPILLQMPVFLALYWTLMESVELRHAPFILWIDDLSVMDPWFVLPILMGISMYLTQMMQPEPPDPIQAKVFKFMPIMFTFLFLWFPSGLVLYWLINNILSVLQQLYVTRQLEKSPRS
jgi:YidC/Oxa1 family membrane protein insertase